MFKITKINIENISLPCFGLGASDVALPLHIILLSRIRNKVKNSNPGRSWLPACWPSDIPRLLERSSVKSCSNRIVRKISSLCNANNINSERWYTTFNEIDSCGYFAVCIGYSSKVLIICWYFTNTAISSECYWRCLGGFGPQQTAFVSCVMCVFAPIVFWCVLNACLLRVVMSMPCFRQLVT